MRANLAPAITYGSAFGPTWGVSCLLLNIFKYPLFCVSTFVFYLPIMVLFVHLCALLGSVRLSLSVQKSRMQMCEFGTIPIAFLTKKFCLVLA